jgi:hypothetical protein
MTVMAIKHGDNHNHGDVPMLCCLHFRIVAEEDHDEFVKLLGNAFFTTFADDLDSACAQVLKVRHPHLSIVAHQMTWCCIRKSYDARQMTGCCIQELHGSRRVREAPGECLFDHLCRRPRFLLRTGPQGVPPVHTTDGPI